MWWCISMRSWLFAPACRRWTVSGQSVTSVASLCSFGGVSALWCGRSTGVQDFVTWCVIAEAAAVCLLLLYSTYMCSRGRVCWLRPPAAEAGQDTVSTVSADL